MKNNDLNFIERYFDKELSKSELAEFETRKKTDPVFAEALAFRQKLKDAFTLGGELDALEKTAVALGAELNWKEVSISSTLEDKQDEPVKTAEPEVKNNTKLIRMYKRAMVAASILFLVCAGCMVHKIQDLNRSQTALESEATILKDQVDSQQYMIAELKGKQLVYEERISGMNLFKTRDLEEEGMTLEQQLGNAHIMIKELAFTALNSISENFLYTSKRFKFEDFISRGSRNVDSLLLAGQQKYKRQDYQGAIADFEQLLNIDGNDNEVLFYKGLCLAMESPDNWKEAILIFEDLLRVKKYYKKEDDLSWHLALLYVKTGQFRKAEGELRKIVEMEEPEHEKKVEAERLLSYFV